MSKNQSIFGSIISDWASHLSGAKIKELQAEDPLSKNLLRQRLCRANCERAVFFAVPAAVLSVIFGIMTVANLKAEIFTQAVLMLSGLILAAAGCGCTGIMIYRQYQKNKGNTTKGEKLTLCFWGIFSAVSLLFILSDTEGSFFLVRFGLYLVIMTVFPLLEIKKAACLVIPNLAAVVAAGIISGAGVYVYLICGGLTFGYLIIASSVFSSFCCLFLEERQLEIANERCRQINEKDTLTGLLNKKGLIKRLTEIMETEGEKNIAAIFFDIDNFRSYNRIYTDSESDECLYNICNCVRIVAKSKTDIISRYGGDEFVIIVQDITEYDLIYFAEQIRKSVERMALPFRDGEIVTVTIGVSSIVEGAMEDYSRLLKEAEDSLALAKAGGKNCVGYMGNVFRAENE